MKGRLNNSARNILNANWVKSVGEKAPLPNEKSPLGLYADGGNLYLQIQRARGEYNWRVNKSWIFRYYHDGRQRCMGIGPYPLIGLSEARERAGNHRKELEAAKYGQGVYPLELRRKRKTAVRPTFTWCREQYLEDFSSEWSNDKHRKQWTSTLTRYADPIIGGLLVSELTKQDIVEVLKPIWLTKPETAKRTRQRIKRVLDWAKAADYLEGENPAALDTGLDLLLPSRNKRTSPVKHHSALPYRDLPQFYAELTSKTSVSARALAFTILTAARTNEIRQMRIEELDGTDWVIPAKRMKAGKEHRIHLTQPAKDLLIFNVGGWLWPGNRGGSLSNMAMLKLCKTMRPGITVHGFRSTFRDWVAEDTDVDGDISELCLAHTVGSEVERAYRRSDLLAKRRDLLERWAAFVTDSQP